MFSRRQLSTIEMIAATRGRFLASDVDNLAENAIRPVAIGRKNWIHLGSQEAGPRIAAIISVVQSCRRVKIPVRDYLGSVLPGLGDLPMHRVPELTPAAWAASRK